MQHYVGLDVSVKETSVCIVDKAGKVIRVVSRFVLELGDAISGISRVPSQAATSIG